MDSHVFVVGEPIRDTKGKFIQARVSVATDGCLRTAISEALYRYYNYDLHKRKSVAIRPNQKTVSRYLPEYCYGIYGYDTAVLPKETEEKVRCGRLKGKLIVQMVPYKYERCSLSRRDFNLWHSACQLNVGGLPPKPKMSGWTVKEYYTSRPFICNITDNQILAYTRACLYRIPWLYPDVAESFYDAYKKSGDFWLSLAFAVNAESDTEIEYDNNVFSTASTFNLRTLEKKVSLSHILAVKALINGLLGLSRLPAITKTAASKTIQTGRGSGSFGLFSSQDSIAKTYGPHFVWASYDHLLHKKTRTLLNRKRKIGVGLPKTNRKKLRSTSEVLHWFIM